MEKDAPLFGRLDEAHFILIGCALVLLFMQLRSFLRPRGPAYYAACAWSIAGIAGLGCLFSLLRLMRKVDVIGFVGVADHADVIIFLASLISVVCADLFWNIIVVLPLVGILVLSHWLDFFKGRSGPLQPD